MQAYRQTQTLIRILCNPPFQTTIYKQISNKRTRNSNSCLIPELYNLRQSLKQYLSYTVLHQTNKTITSWAYVRDIKNALC